MAAKPGLVGHATMCGQASGTMTAAAGKMRWVAPCDGEIVGVTAAVLTAPTGATLIVDVNKGGTTIFTTQGNRPTIAISGTSTAVKTPDVTSFSAGDVFTVDVDQIGSSVAGADLHVCVAFAGN